MKLNELKPKSANTSSIRIGRGGKRGKTSGRGHKGQRAHGGHGIRPEIRDRIKKLPKLRGYKFNSIQDKPLAINLAILDEKFNAGDKVDPVALLNKKIITKTEATTKAIKVLGNGNITKKLVISGMLISKSAKEKLEAQGGSVQE